MAEFASKPKPNMFNPTIVSNITDKDVDTEVEYITEGIRNISPRSNNSSRLSHLTRNLSITPYEPEKPTEEDFINFYFKDKDTNENIKRIYEKYMEVKENFEKEKTPHAYIDTNTVPKKQQSSAGWELVYKNKPYAYNVDSQKVTLDIEGKTYKDFIVNKDEYATIFMITLEIAMQKLAYDILKSETDIIIPEITNHYLLDLKNENCRIIIEMDYIEHKDLQEGKVDKAMKALDILRDHNIYHFDTHNENIVQSVKDDQVVILDFGKAQITKTPDISSTTGLFKVHEKKKDKIKFDFKDWIERTKPNSQMIRDDVDFYGGKKTKSKRKTRKGKNKRKSKKTKKRTYRKRK
tara:strand:+ start:774 stop:1823 length:1050 start_codon:yes stop_codon:yes gene_type:complete